jgi:hypothetical protein
VPDPGLRVRLRALQVVEIFTCDVRLGVIPGDEFEQIQSDSTPPCPSPGGPTPGGLPGTPASQLSTRFHGSVSLDATRVGRDAGRIADEVISHLTALVGSEVKVTLEIEAQVPNGVPENTVRTVTENSRTLKFDTHGFEKE